MKTCVGLRWKDGLGQDVNDDAEFDVHAAILTRQVVAANAVQTIALKASGGKQLVGFNDPNGQLYNVVDSIAGNGEGIPTEKAVADYIANALANRACDYREWRGSVNTGKFSAALGTLWTNRAKYSMIICISGDMSNICVSSSYDGDYTNSTTHYFSDISWFILFPNVQNTTGNGDSSSYGGPEGQMLIGVQAFNAIDWANVHNKYTSDSRLQGRTNAPGVRIFVGADTHIGAVAADRYHTFIGVLK